VRAGTGREGDDLSVFFIAVVAFPLLLLLLLLVMEHVERPLERDRVDRAGRAAPASPPAGPDAGPDAEPDAAVSASAL
jgi:hypothetical protein